MRGRRRRDDDWDEGGQDGQRDPWWNGAPDDWGKSNRTDGFVPLDPPGFGGATQAGPGYQRSDGRGFDGAGRGAAGHAGPAGQWRGDQRSGGSQRFGDASRAVPSFDGGQGFDDGGQGFGGASRGGQVYDAAGQGFGDPTRVVRGLDGTGCDPGRGGPAYGASGYGDPTYGSPGFGPGGQGVGGPGYTEHGYSGAGNPGPAHDGTRHGGAGGYGAGGYGNSPSPSYGYAGSGPGPGFGPGPRPGPGFGDSGFGGAGQSGGYGGYQDTSFGSASYGFGETSATAQYGRSPAQLTSGQGSGLADGEYAVSDWGATANGSEPATPRPYGRLSIFTLLEDKAAEFDRLAGVAAEGVRTTEPDTLVYVIHVVPKAPMQRIIYEIYRDRAAFESHERQPHIQRFGVDRQACVLATNIIDLRLKYAKVAALGAPAAASPAEETSSGQARRALESAPRAPSFNPHGSGQYSALGTGGYAEPGNGRAADNGGGRYRGPGPDRPTGSESRPPRSSEPAWDQPSYQGGRYGRS